LYSTTTTGYSTAVGYQAGFSATSGIISAFGQYVLRNNTTGNANAGFGGYDGSATQTLASNTTGSYNSAFGMGALAANTTASNQTAVGYQALYSTTTAGANTAIGTQALYNNTTGQLNTAVGYRALYTANVDGYSTAVGANCLESTTTGSLNVAMGRLAGNSLTTGSNNTILGYSAGIDAVANITTQSNYIVMGNNSNTNAYIKISWTVTSDARDKTSFTPVPHGLAFVNSLTPTAYQFRISREDETPTGPVRYGFKAQDILAAEGDTPVIIDKTDPENLKYNQDSMIAVLVNAIKELKSEIDQLKGNV
jgi:hypothetical protein